MTDNYKKSLELFEMIYFDENGDIDKSNWGFGIDNLDKKEYIENVYVPITKISRIRGRSAFTPRIIFKTSNKGWRYDEGKFFLTLDQKGRFAAQRTKYFYKENDITEIDISDWSKKDIMEEVEKILNFSNEEIMKYFSIKDLGSPYLTTALLIDDVIQDYLEDGFKADKVTPGGYYEDSILRKACKKLDNEAKRNFAAECRPIEPFKSWQLIGVKEITSDSDKDYYTTNRIVYRIITPEKVGDIGSIQVRIEDVKGQSECIDRIIDMLEEKFPDRENEINMGEQRIESITNDSPRKKNSNEPTPHEAYENTLKVEETGDKIDALMEMLMRAHKDKNKGKSDSNNQKSDIDRD